MTKLKNSKYERKNVNVTNLKMWQKSKTQNVTQLKNSLCDKTYQFKMWQNSKTQNVAKKKGATKNYNATELKNTKCDIIQ